MDLDTDFDPLAMFAGLAAGGSRVQAVFLGPPPPSLQAQVRQLLTDGTGPLTSLEEQFRRQGSQDPAGELRRMFSAAQGVCVVVVARDHGLVAIPQLWFGSLESSEVDRLVAGCADQAGDSAELRRVVSAIPPRAWPGALATLDGAMTDPGTTREAWLAIAAGVVQASQSALIDLAAEGTGSGPRERLADLAWWTAEALAALAVEAPGEDPVLGAELEVRCRLLTGEVVTAGQALDRLAAGGNADDLGEVLAAFVDIVRRSPQASAAAVWLAERLPVWDAQLGEPYETAQALFRLQVATQRPTAELLASSALMAQRNRKSMRQDLTREPIWEVIDASGVLLDPAEAAQLAQRSTVAMVKRMESGTVPWTRKEGMVRIPAQALESWLAILAAHGLTP